METSYRHISLTHSTSFNLVHFRLKICIKTCIENIYWGSATQYKQTSPLLWHSHAKIWRWSHSACRASKTQPHRLIYISIESHRIREWYVWSRFVNFSLCRPLIMQNKTVISTYIWLVKSHGNHSVVFLMVQGCKKVESAIHVVSTENCNQKFWHLLTRQVILWHCFRVQYTKYGRILYHKCLHIKSFTNMLWPYHTLPL